MSLSGIYVIKNTITEACSPIFLSGTPSLAKRAIEDCVKSLYIKGELHEDDEFVLLRCGTFSHVSLSAMPDNHSSEPVFTINALDYAKKHAQKQEVSAEAVPTSQRSEPPPSA